jgi:hypothetical protein
VSIAGDRKRLTPDNALNDLSAVVTQFSDRYLSHKITVSRVRHRSSNPNEKTCQRAYVSIGRSNGAPEPVSSLYHPGIGSARDHALASLLALNGLRISEALGTNIEDLGYEPGHRVLKDLRKGGKHAELPLAPRTSGAVDLCLGERTSGPIFLGAKGGRINHYAADRTVKRLARRAGVNKSISPHSRRHSFITAGYQFGRWAPAPGHTGSSQRLPQDLTRRLTQS